MTSKFIKNLMHTVDSIHYGFMHVPIGISSVIETEHLHMF